MPEKEVELGRLKLKLDKTVREINQQVINPEIPELVMEDIEPVFRLVARCRAAYLKKLFQVTLAAGKGLPDASHIDELANLRESYEELLHSTHALETAIERGYLDIMKS